MEKAKNHRYNIFTKRIYYVGLLLKVACDAPSR